MGGYMCAVDVVVNSVCVYMVTAYYPDRVYYERLCYLCLLCCPMRYRSNGKKGQVANPLQQQQTVMAVPSKSSKTSDIDYNDEDNEPLSNNQVESNTNTQVNV